MVLRSIPMGWFVDSVLLVRAMLMWCTQGIAIVLAVLLAGWCGGARMMTPVKCWL
ncbi:hypothetical protein [Bartonella sp. AP58NXGY]|uniref:hypothetical protein n=1 Tax=Bartonella sp. AP58NXGY TaxID=3243498 RepID=UPI0035D0CF0A